MSFNCVVDGVFLGGVLLDDYGVLPNDDGVLPDDDSVLDDNSILLGDDGVLFDHQGLMSMGSSLMIFPSPCLNSIGFKQNFSPQPLVHFAILPSQANVNRIEH